jgi:CRISPR-associated protein Csx14
MDGYATLVATLGGKPQLITFLLDLLLARGEQIDDVMIIYLSQYRRSRAAYERLKKEFSNDQYAGKPCQLRCIPIKTRGGDLNDIRTPEEVEAVRRHIHRLFDELKEQGRSIHLGLSGGRRLMSFVALTAAMQYLTPVDHIWHIYTDPELIEKAGDGNVLHAPPGMDLRLIPVPFVPWVSFFPGLGSLLNRSPQEMGEASLGWLNEEERDRCGRVWQALTPRQRDVLQAFATDISRQKVAKRLNIAVTTVDSHRERILKQCGLVWDAQVGETLDIQFLQKYFGPYLAGFKRGPSAKNPKR